MTDLGLIALQPPPDGWKDGELGRFLEAQGEVERWYMVRLRALYAVAFVGLAPALALLLPGVVPASIGSIGCRVWSVLFSWLVLVRVAEYRERRRALTLLAMLGRRPARDTASPMD